MKDDQANRSTLFNQGHNIVTMDAGLFFIITHVGLKTGYCIRFVKGDKIARTNP